MRMIILIIGLLAAAPASAQELHTFHCLHGCPRGAPDTNPIVVREIYTLSANVETKFADWVAYRVTPDTVGGTQTRTWRQDPWLDPAVTLHPDDYTDANRVLGTDRGHQAPLAAFTGTAFWRYTNILSNITPQQASLNQGAWERLEAAVRNLAANDEIAVHVITGPLYERPMPPLPQSTREHAVPSGYWKVIILESGEAAAFIMEQETPRRANFCTFRVDLSEVESRSGLSFYPRLAQRNLSELAPRLGC